MLADQKPVLEQLTEGVPEAVERFTDEDELARVSELLSTVDNIQELTGIDFGDAVRRADLRGGAEGLGGPESLSPVTSASAELLLRYSQPQPPPPVSPAPPASQIKRKPR